MNREREIKNGIILGYIVEIVKLVISFFYTPYLLRYIGQSEYGVWQLVESMVAYLGLLNFGYAGSYLKFYTKYKHNSQDDEIARLNGLFLILFNIIALIALILGMVGYINLSRLLGDEIIEPEMQLAKKLWIIYLLNMIVGFWDTVFVCYIFAKERFVFPKILALIATVAVPGISIMLLKNGYGVVSTVCIALIIRVICFGIDVFLSLNKLSMVIKFNDIRLSLLKQLSSFAFFIFFSQMIDQVNWNVDRYLLGRFVGTTAIAVYGVASTINGIYLQCSVSISNVFIPKVNQMVVRKEEEELTYIFSRIGRVQFETLMLILLAFIFWGEEFIILWVGQEYKQAYYVALYLIVPVTIPFIQNIGIEIQKAKNLHKWRSSVYAVIAIMNIIISIPLIKQYNEVGAAMGTAVALVTGNVIFMNFFYHFKVKIDMIYFWKQIVSLVPAVLIVTIVANIIKRIISITNIYSIILSVAVFAFLYFIVFWLVGLNAEEKNYIKKILKISNH